MDAGAEATGVWAAKKIPNGTPTTKKSTKNQTFKNPFGQFEAMY